MIDRIDYLRDIARSIGESGNMDVQLQPLLSAALNTIAEELEYLRETKARKP